MIKELDKLQLHYLSILDTWATTLEISDTISEYHFDATTRPNPQPFPNITASFSGDNTTRQDAPLFDLNIPEITYVYSLYLESFFD